GMIEIVDENMANAARVHAIERGKVIGRHCMVAFGGSAPLHAARLAEKLGIERVIVPAGAGVGSAIGFLRAPLAYEVVRSRRIPLAAFDAVAANDLIALMAEEARAVLTPALGEGLSNADPERSLVVDMRYIGQGHELAIPLPKRSIEPADGEVIAALFETTYQEIYGVRLDHVGIEITAWSLTLSASVSTDRLVAAPAAVRKRAGPMGWRDVYEPAHGGFRPFALHRRADLLPGAQFEGPAIVMEDQTSTIVPAGWQVSIAGNLEIVLERAGEGAA
ncbi:MAG: hydantoinase/oxoprolinase family protein, partial [Geminicoccaceae bacterium]